MVIEILKVPPISGQFIEFKFNAFGDCTWVKFSNQDSTAVGIFGNAGLPESSVTLFNDDKYAFILAAGQGYIVEMFTMKLTYQTENNLLTHAKAIPDTKLIAAGDFFSVHLYSVCGLIWTAERVGRDDLKIEQATANLISGTYWNGTGVSSFTLDVTSVVSLRGHC